VEYYQPAEPGTLDRAMYGYREILRTTWNLVVRYGREPEEYLFDLKAVLFNAVVTTDMESPGTAYGAQTEPFDDIAVSYRGAGVLRCPTEPVDGMNAWDDYERGTSLTLGKEQARFVSLFDFHGDPGPREYDYAEIIVVDAAHPLHGWRVLLPFRECHFWDLTASTQES